LRALLQLVDATERQLCDERFARPGHPLLADSRHITPESAALDS